MCKVGKFVREMRRLGNRGEQGFDSASICFRRHTESPIIRIVIGILVKYCLGSMLLNGLTIQHVHWSTDIKSFACECTPG